MEIIWLILLLLAGAGSVYFITDFALMFFNGVRTRGEITGFIKGKYMRLPVLKFTDEQEREHEFPAGQIDQLLYLLNPAQERDLIDIIYRRDDPANMRVFGTLRLIAALFIVLPVLMMLVGAIGQAVMASQLAYLIIMGLILVGGFTIIKLIQRYY